MKILHTADLHLKEYRDERWKTLEKLISIGKKEKIGLFVISGDLFDKGINAEDLRPKIRKLFSKTGYNIVLIPGNHDIDSYRSGMHFGEDVTLLTDLNAPFEFKDVRVWGMPFEHIGSEEVLNKLHSIKDKLTTDKKNILLFHGELLDAFYSRKDFGDEGDERYMPVKLSYFKGLNVNYVLAGHFHSKFDFWTLEDGGYFVYPGSPISITRREIRERKVNIFELGKKPIEYLLDTPYFENIVIEFNPLKDKNPSEKVKKQFSAIPKNAKVILTVKGFINGEMTNTNETELNKQIEKIVKEKCVEKNCEFKDIHEILEDDLFKRFNQRLEETDFDEYKKEQMRNIAIRVMMEVKA